MHHVIVHAAEIPMPARSDSRRVSPEDLAPDRAS